MTLASRAAAFGELDAATLYALLRLRVDVFVVEQRCAYPELDGRDTEPGTVHHWISDGDQVVACLRVLEEPDGAARIGRVAVARDARGAGLAGRLLATALAELEGRRCVLDAQRHLTGIYERFGFSPCGPEFVEDGIPHVPMRRNP